MADLITIARPYAKAAFDFAVEKNGIESWHKMLVLTSQVSQDPQVRSILTSDMKTDSVANLLINICKDVLDEFSTNFIKIMAENKRLSLLPEVLTLFEQYCLDRDSQADVDVISADELTNEQLNKISVAVEKRLSRKVKLKCHIDKSLISGFIIRTGDMVIDSSIRGRLNRLNDALQS
ncbi:F0F1 ATP synthase subunit delta [Gilliamella sp. Pra-s65]|uniref:F0F1 ATP synthase subunit delta n=1 Tax=unclassified Gilliamella TaxID=2685620 RepID=UPI0013287DB8|nr:MULTISPECIES: F0F1 ATP synthase subunit delta [unclassified Gilliamella]MWN32347.1 F0F1 ATP synthase subunit delta [Gilliamella sp. Pra-s60]MWN91108.1 F0F1 ATP synthase subunit delta [Gilliamella sp. Pra-s65]MWP29649.1 F0F1 ATP synthase subunit delta [Gilliamella sp. Pra-s54]MWP73934.1 F0F1 ATP synthase subunit delta [Gilliamella sp. Pra-s52]